VNELDGKHKVFSVSGINVSQRGCELEIELVSKNDVIRLVVRGTRDPCVQFLLLDVNWYQKRGWIGAAYHMKQDWFIQSSSSW
jgi:hypothetical protein